MFPNEILLQFRKSHLTRSSCVINHYNEVKHSEGTILILILNSRKHCVVLLIILETEYPYKVDLEISVHFIFSLWMKGAGSGLVELCKMEGIKKGLKMILICF